MALLSKSQVIKKGYYRKPRMMGDRWAKNLVDYYFSEREKIFKYSGRSAVSRSAVGFYEPYFIKAGWDFWFHNADKKYLTTLLWFFRRLKAGQSKTEEKKLFTDFYLKLNYWRKMVINTNKGFVDALKKRWKGVK